jgi:small-conductance mechanosensitive channel
MRQHWIRLDSRLKGWQETLESRSDDLGQANTKLNAMREQWKTTAASAAGSGVPEELLGQARSLQISIDEVDKQIGERLSAVLTLLGRITELRTMATAAGADVDEARVLARNRILAPDSPTLWEAIFYAGSPISFSEQLRDTWKQDSEQYRIFLNAYRQRVPLQILFFAALSILMVVLWLRVRTQEVSEEDASLRTAIRIFSRPFSAAFALTLLSTRFFYGQAPLIIYETNILLVLIPIVRLVPRLVVRGLRPAVYGLSGLFVLQQFHDLAVDQTLLQRLVLLLTSSAGLVGAAWLVRAGGPASSHDGGRWWKASVLGIRLSIPPFAGAVLANLVGSVALAELLTSATLSSAFGAVALAICVAILDALLTMLIRSRAAKATGMVTRHGDLIARRLSSLIRVAGLVIWIVATLHLFRLLEVTWIAVGNALNKSWEFGNLTISIGSVLAFFLAIIIAIYLSRLVRFVLEEDVFPRLPLQRGVPSTLSMLINYSILTLGFLFAMAAAGIEVSQFAIIFGALGVGIGFGLQNVVNNFISGLILVFERPIKVGDTIEVGQMIGDVRRIGIRSSTVRTFEGAEVIVPNGNLVSSEVINWTKSDRTRRIKIPAGVAYGTDPQKVLDILLGVAKDTKDVLRFPEPYPLFKPTQRRFGRGKGLAVPGGLTSGDRSNRFLPSGVVRPTFWIVQGKTWISNETVIRHCHRRPKHGMDAPQARGRAGLDPFPDVCSHVFLFLFLQTVDSSSPAIDIPGSAA